MVTKALLGLFLMVSLIVNIKQKFQKEELLEEIGQLQAKYKAIREYAEFLSSRKSKKE